MKSSDNETKNVRLQTFIAHCGVCSRRSAMELLKNGAVKVNGQITKEPSTPIRPGRDSVKVNNKLIHLKSFEYVVLHKPKDYITTKSDRFAKRTVYDLLPKKLHHLTPVGRLDRDSQGLLLLTNDGDLTFRLTHPSFRSNKVYFVKTTGQISPKDKMRLQKGIYLDGKRTASAKISYLKTSNKFSQFQMTLYEGRNRQIRRMVKAVGQKVLFLKRLSHGPIHLGTLASGRWRFLNKKEKEKLMSLSS